MRLFVAVDVPGEVKDAIEHEVVDRLRELPGAKWSRPEGRHLTLSFLGEVDDARIPLVQTALRTATRGHDAFDASFDAIGAFPNLRRPRVLWIGLSEGRDQIVAVQRDVEASLAREGFEAEDREYHPHLTLARFVMPQKLEVPDVTMPPTRFRVGGIVLFCSELHPKGARYTTLDRFDLG